MDDAVAELLDRPEPVVLDGGLGTTLAARGHDLRDTLWSARLLLDDPDAIRAVHTAFADAGARIVTTASYQLAARSLADAGRDPSLAAGLLRRSVELAREAVGMAVVPDHALVAASVGPYGAVLADGSEYRGHYGLSVEELVAFHAPRVDALLGARPDLLAFETVPSAIEVAAIGRLLAGSGARAWVSVTLGDDGLTLADGYPLREALAPVVGLEEVVAVGVNCCPPGLVGTALTALGGIDRPLVVYPNIGERWDADRRSWTTAGPSPRVSPPSWVTAGAHLIGGCCGTGPSDIARLARDLGRPGGAT
jgi:homocysteine S-methyltransferase